MKELFKKLKECIKNAQEDEKKGVKHKGLIIQVPNKEKSKEYIAKAKKELELCDFYKEKGFDYKIPEEWFYTLYYCALAILSKFGIESRSQRYTALFLKYAKEKNLIEYDEEFIQRITVYSKKGEESEVDKREEARYSSSIKIEAVKERYNEITLFCKKAIFQAEEIVFSAKELIIPKELYD
ncbi:hypothetical protein HYW76_03180 [Candidatus Pacearchaeota archaeon]|nr:hypothetical protein [Candidatus Pacearchaeota archaeon]